MTVSVEFRKPQKIKKKDGVDISFKKTKDILKKLGSIKKNQILFGFALETNKELENAQKKLKDKKPCMHQQKIKLVIKKF